jgi:L-ascorbate metabolism protein UlaG (beta-lactamase superfamily)
MSITVTWLGHATFSLDINGTIVLIDPFLTGNPMASAKAEDLDADFILISHGHHDHVGDAVSIAKRTGAGMISNAEISGWLAEKGIETAHGQHIGGGFHHPFGYVKLTISSPIRVREADDCASRLKAARRERWRQSVRLLNHS